MVKISTNILGKIRVGQQSDPEKEKYKDLDSLSGEFHKPKMLDAGLTFITLDELKVKAIRFLKAVDRKLPQSAISAAPSEDKGTPSILVGEMTQSEPPKIPEVSDPLSVTTTGNPVTTSVAPQFVQGDTREPYRPPPLPRQAPRQAASSSVTPETSVAAAALFCWYFKQWSKNLSVSSFHLLKSNGKLMVYSYWKHLKVRR